MTTALLSVPPAAEPHGNELVAHLDQLELVLGGAWIVLERATGRRRLLADTTEAGDVYPELRALLPGGREPVVLVEELPLLLLAMPLPKQGGAELVACGLFSTAQQEEYVAPRIANLLHYADDQLNQCVRDQTVWNKYSLLRTAELLCQNLALQARVKSLEFEVEQVSDNLAATYEEISLLYGITQNLRLSSSDTELGAQALDWLSECLPAQSLAAIYLPVKASDELTYEARLEPELLTCGETLLELDELLSIVDQLQLTAESQPYVGNWLASQRDWKYPQVDNLVIAPLSEGKNLFGWLVAMNHRREAEFGTVEAALLNSVAVILGTHGGNIELYRQHREFLACVVRALTSAIDAKDPYTCGHSDRVARVSVRLAQELACDDELLNTIYMAGLVHDIGKIGIDDEVLRKPGRLTNAEFEQIKLHPELGYKILADIKQFADVLPVVLHHHEQWDGQGYPHGLAGEEIPLLARICAVADAYDAMSSDRPYRRGMPDDKVDAIFRSGSGQQWDSRVVDAFFSARDDIREISRRERANLTLDVQQWARLPSSVK